MGVSCRTAYLFCFVLYFCITSTVGDSVKRARVALQWRHERGAPAYRSLRPKTQKINTSHVVRFSSTPDELGTLNQERNQSIEHHRTCSPVVGAAVVLNTFTFIYE